MITASVTVAAFIIIIHVGPGMDTVQGKHIIVLYIHLTVMVEKQPINPFIYLLTAVNQKRTNCTLVEVYIYR